MTKTIKLRIYNKEDYFTSIGSWDEVETYLDENNMTEQEFNNLQDKILNTDDVIELTTTQDIINEYINNDKSDMDLELQSLVYEYLNNMYNIDIPVFDIEVLEIR